MDVPVVQVGVGVVREERSLLLGWTLHRSSLCRWTLEGADLVNYFLTIPTKTEAILFEDGDLNREENSSSLTSAVPIHKSNQQPKSSLLFNWYLVTKWRAHTTSSL